MKGYRVKSIETETFDDPIPIAPIPKPEKKEAKPTMEATPTPIPTQEIEQPVLSTMPEKARNIFYTVNSSKEPRRIQSVNEIQPRILMEVPKEIADQYPERAYKWGAISSVDQEVAEYDGMWVVVNKSNHSHISQKLFDLTYGGITYGGQNILMYTWRSNRDILNEKVIMDFVNSEKALEKKMNSGSGGVYMEQISDIGDGRDAKDMDPDLSYDFGSPR